MTAKTLEEEAREAAERTDREEAFRYSPHYRNGLHDGLVRGMAIGHTARDKEIEELRARVKELEEMVRFRDEFMRERYRQAFTDCFPSIPLPGEGG